MKIVFVCISAVVRLNDGVSQPERTMLEKKEQILKGKK